jgi:hypothetical protein
MNSNKVGRNDPCPCNSGKKFKKCHGQVLSPNPDLHWLGSVGVETKAAEFKAPGLPGMNLQLILQAGYQDKQSLKNVSNLPRSYRVIFTLSRPGHSPVGERNFSPSQTIVGDSHIAIAPPALTYLDGNVFDKLRFEIATPNGNFTFTGHANDRGFLAKIESEPFQADEFGDAALRAMRAVAPALSSMSACLDVPANIYQLHVVELRTNTHRISIKSPFKEVIGWLPAIDSASDEQQKYASLYREALNSTSSNYMFLCLYRIIEGLRSRREGIRANVVAEALAQGERPPPQPDETIPTDGSDQKQWLSALYATPQDWDDLALEVVFIPDIVGRRVRNLIDKGQELHKLRNKIAHAVLDSGEPMISIDSGVDIDEVEKWLPITRFLARYLLVDSFPQLFRA